MSDLATTLGIDYGNADPVGARVNRIRYPRPNTLGLAALNGKLTPYAETILGRVKIVED